MFLNLKWDFLILELEQNWEAIDGNPVEADRRHFFINVCHTVLPTGGAVNCSREASICSVGEYVID